jgi:isopentenyl-diphosphate delta-isomerase
MDEEIVDIIDLDGVILHQVKKTDAHKTGLLHRTVIADIRDSKGNWLLVKQAGHKQDAGQYVVPVGGHVTAGESEEEALRREALEEVGLTDFEHELVGRTIFERKIIGRHENHYFTIFRIISDEPLRLNNESVGYRAFPEDELKKLLQEKPEQFGAAFFVLLEQFYPHMLTDTE